MPLPSKGCVFMLPKCKQESISTSIEAASIVEGKSFGRVWVGEVCGMETILLHQSSVRKTDAQVLMRELILKLCLKKILV